LREEEKKNRPHYGTVNFEKRRHPRFDVDLPIEYVRSDLAPSHNGTINASEGGLLVDLREKVEVGQYLSLKLFFTLGSELTTIKALVRVVWTDMHPGEGREDYRTGVEFADISPEDMEKLRKFLDRLSGEINQGTAYDTNKEEV